MKIALCLITWNEIDGVRHDMPMIDHTLMRRGIGDFLVFEKDADAGGPCRSRIVDESPFVAALQH